LFLTDEDHIPVAMNMSYLCEAELKLKTFMHAVSISRQARVLEIIYLASPGLGKNNTSSRADVGQTMHLHRLQARLDGARD
jgi:hypothetical protein